MDVGLVCDACSALTPIGVPQCKRCGSAVALDPRPPLAAKTQESTATLPCPKCSELLTGDHKFCPSCGHRIPAMDNFDVETRVGPLANQPKKKADAPMARATGKPKRSKAVKAMSIKMLRSPMGMDYAFLLKRTWRFLTVSARP